MKKKLFVRKIVAIVLIVLSCAFLFWPRMVQPANVLEYKKTPKVAKWLGVDPIVTNPIVSYDATEPTMEAVRTKAIKPEAGILSGSFSGILTDANDYKVYNKNIFNYWKNFKNYNEWVENHSSVTILSDVSERFHLDPSNTTLTEEEFNQYKKQVNAEQFQISWLTVLFYLLVFVGAFAVIMMMMNQKGFMNIVHTVIAVAAVVTMIIYMVHYKTGIGISLILMPLCSLGATILYKKP